MPTNVVTLLITDLVGSTARRVRLGEDRYDRFRVQHDALVTECVVQHRGEVAKHTGDGIMAAFRAASDAVAAATAIQQSVERANRDTGDPIAVRIGMSAGDVSVEDGDYFGTPPVEASRLCARAEGGEILAADVVRILAGSRGAHVFAPLGALDLKGLPPLEAVAVQWVPAAAPPHGDPIDPRTVRLVGRSADVQQLEAELARAHAGECRAVLVLGEPGIGKSRIATELLDLHRDEVIALAARAFPLGAMASLALWTEAIERRLRMLDSEEIVELCGPYSDDLAALLPSVAKVRGVPIDRGPSPGRLLAALGALVENLSAGATVLITLDDVHLADGSSWEVLNHLVRNLVGVRVLIVMTARPIELAEHQIASETVHGLQQDGLLQRWTLGPLGPVELRELAGAWFGPERVGEPLVGWLADRSRGVSLFAIGLLRALADEDADLEHPRLRSLPEDLAARVHARLERLDPACRALLELQAVVGSRMELADLVALCGQPLDRAAGTIDVLVRLRLVDEDEQGRELSYEIAHPLIQDAIYERIGGARRRALHRHVARVLVAQGSYGAAAGHFVRSADVGDAEAVEGLCEALTQAEGRDHHHEALRLLDALLTVLPAGDPRWLDVLDALAWQSDWVVDHRADAGMSIALRSMRNIAQLVERSPDPTRRGVVRFHLGSFLVWGGGDLDAGRAMVDEARALFEEAGQPHRALLARNELGYLAAIGGDEDGHEAIAAAVLLEAEQQGDRFVELQALCSLVFHRQWTGRVEESGAFVDRGLALARADARWYRTSYLLGQRAFRSALEGDAGAAAEDFAAGKAANPSYRDTLLPDHEIISAWLGGRLAAAAGGGQDLVDRGGGVLGTRRLGCAFATLAALELGRDSFAEQLLAVCEPLYADRRFWMHADLVEWARGALLAGQGRGPEAIAALHAVLASMRSMGHGLPGRFVAFDLAELGVELGDRDAVAAAAEACRALPADIPGLRAVDACAEGAVAVLGAELEHAAECFGEATAAFGASSWPLLQARSAVLEARAVARGDRAGAAATLQGALDTFTELGAAVRRDATGAALAALGPPGRRARTAVSGPDALSRREREVVVLAVEGLSAREIGTRLFIGERTVETHLAHVYAKLGIRSRVELVRLGPALGL